MKKNIITFCFALLLTAASTAAAVELTITDTWYDIYGIIYEGTNRGRTTQDVFNVIRGGREIGAFELFHVEKELSKGKFKPSGLIKSLMKGDVLEPVTPGESAAKENPGDARRHFDLGLGYLNTKEPQKAVQELNIAVKLDPDNPDIHDALSAAYTQLNDTESAERERQMAERLGGKPAEEKITSNSAALNQQQEEKKTTEPEKKTVEPEKKAADIEQHLITAPPLKARPLKFEPEAEEKKVSPHAPAAQPKAASDSAVKTDASGSRIDALIEELKGVGNESKEPEKKENPAPAAPPKPVEASPAKNESSGSRIDALIEQLRGIGQKEDDTEADSSAWKFDQTEAPTGTQNPKSEPAKLSDISSSYNNMGILRIQFGDYKEAISYFEKALEIHPDQPIFHRNKAVALAKLGKYDEAMKCAGNALRHGDPLAPELMESISALMKQ